MLRVMLLSELEKKSRKVNVKKGLPMNYALSDLKDFLLGKLNHFQVVRRNA